MDNVSFRANRGEIHSLIGENGAGKSTLIKILTGALRKDSGEIFIEGKLAEIDNPQKASTYGISTIFQELSLFDNMSIAENIFIGREFTNIKYFVNKKRLLEEAAKILEILNFSIPPKKLVRDLSMSEKQVVEIAKALSRSPKIIIMDEPTSSLAEREKEVLFEIIRRLKENGTLIIFISHKLDEIVEISDRLTILRDGKNVGTYHIKEITPNQIIELMTGSKAFKDNIIYIEPKQDVVLKVKNLSKGKILKKINFELYKGEILGITGLIGSGKSELARAILGIDPPDGGDIFLENKRLNNISIGRAIKFGFGFVSENRKRDSLFPELTIRENITMSSLNRFCKFYFISRNKERKEVQIFLNELRIKTPSEETKVNYLSGGNQQKVAISKCLLSGSKILILDEPTIGVDIGVKSEIHNIILELARQGVSIIMISSDFREIYKVSSRIMIMKAGEIKGIFPKENININEVMFLAMN
ncbi:MAG: sugar ABC transporter ATP-binding protein [Actinobacteria bacterium]|nr:sugar ABC transporter ATP-binding protein [Actinomycetota bacterium]